MEQHYQQQVHRALNQDHQLDAHITLYELQQVLTNKDTAPDTDKIPYSFYQNLPTNPLLTILKLINIT